MLAQRSRRPAARDTGDVTVYRRPGWFTSHIFNPIVAGCTRAGISVLGSRVLEVQGRVSGEPRRTPVNLLVIDGTSYLVAPRGETQWVRNLRARGNGRLLLGRRAEAFTATELDIDEKLPVLRAYLKRWKAEVGIFFDGVGPGSPDDDLRRIAPAHPAFRISVSSDQGTVTE
jgi:deazaflavin-dependent oxidoreductase (nitroreductase family)